MGDAVQTTAPTLPDGLVAADFQRTPPCEIRNSDGTPCPHAALWLATFTCLGTSRPHQHANRTTVRALCGTHLRMATGGGISCVVRGARPARFKLSARPLGGTR